MLDLKRLRVFEEVASRGSFQAAADALSYTGPAVSHHVAQLEAEIGAKLVNRRGRGPYLTPVGVLLLEHARAILGAVAGAEQALSEALGAISRVRVGAFATANASIVADAVVGLHGLYPQMRVEVLEGELPETLERLRVGAIDVAIVFDSAVAALADDPDVQVEYLGMDELLLALPAGHSRASSPAARLSAHAGDAWIEGARPDSPASLILVDACARAGFTPRIAFNSGNYPMVLRLVDAGLGVALVPRLALSQLPPGVVARRLDDAVPARRVGLMTRRGGFRPASLGDVAGVLRETAARWLSPMDEAA